MTSTPEYQKLTVLVCDLVGSTRLAARMDPEEFREVVGSYHRIVEDAVAALDGQVTQYLGDGIAAYFGRSGAPDEAARRAVRGGLDLVDVVARLGDSSPGVRGQGLAVRVGIHTGPVLLGDDDARGGGQMAFGEAPRLAARVGGIADPGTVVVSAETRDLVPRCFDWVDLGARMVKDLIRPVRLFQALRQRPRPV